MYNTTVQVGGIGKGGGGGGVNVPFIQRGNIL